MNDVMIFGASVRSAAESALRAGMRPVCADLFADEDLREIAEILPVDAYPSGLVEAVAQAPDVPWIYTGALENRPGLLAKLGGLRTLWGNPADVVRAVRNPFRLHAVLEGSRLPALAVRRKSLPPPADGSWLLKPRQGSAGRGIRVWQAPLASAASTRGWNEPIYFQKRAAGLPISALFLATAAGTALVGTSDQLIGLEDLLGCASPFTFCGAWGPVPPPAAVRTQIAATGDAVAAAFDLRGLFGIDFMREGEIAWPTEVNPRYTATVEIYERAFNLPLLDWHGRACRAYGDRSASRTVLRQLTGALEKCESLSAGRTVLKAIVYAPFSLCVPDLAAMGGGEAFAAQSVEIADRPRAGQRLPACAPVCTLIVKPAQTQGTVRLQAALFALRAQFGQQRVEAVPEGRDV